MTTTYQIELRSDTAANWNTANPVLGVGEIGVELGSTPAKFKIGDGVSAWTALVYAATGLPLLGGTMSGPIAMGTNPITGVSQITFSIASLTVTSNAVTVTASSHAQSKFTVSAATTVTMSTSGASDGQCALVKVFDGGTAEGLTWVNTENPDSLVVSTSRGSSSIPSYFGFIYNGTTSKWTHVMVA